MALHAAAGPRGAAWFEWLSASSATADSNTVVNRQSSSLSLSALSFCCVLVYARACAWRMQLAAGESGEPIDVWLMFAAAEREGSMQILIPFCHYHEPNPKQTRTLVYGTLRNHVAAASLNLPSRTNTHALASSRSPPLPGCVLCVLASAKLCKRSCLITDKNHYLRIGFSAILTIDKSFLVYTCYFYMRQKQAVFIFCNMHRV